MSAIKHFLLVFDHSKNELISNTDFGTDIDKATRAYGEMEKRYRGSYAVDIVLVGSDSIETVKVTHANYFVNGSINKIRDVLSLNGLS
ncbi:hypothetical protein [Arthrobacter woluwensis]|uniref:hypothetical protein n=1 Tax=Arthrobacter woluwensis TaxID=156980 RepID=UPI00119E172A|nr:hypothetical protein [Arthrobacter woluwensis]